MILPFQKTINLALYKDTNVLGTHTMGKCTNKREQATDLTEEDNK